jgi:hypothetical protein
MLTIKVEDALRENAWLHRSIFGNRASPASLGRPMSILVSLLRKRRQKYQSAGEKERVLHYYGILITNFIQ